MFSEHELIIGCKKGKVSYQEGLYKQFYSFAMSICLRYTRNREDALEILNDSFLKVFEKINQFDEQKSFKSWFRRIVINSALDHYRANKKHEVLIDLSIEEVDAQTEFEFEQDLKTDEILKIFNQMPDNYRVIFNLFEIENYSHDEIAQHLSISVGTSRSHLSRAKKLLRQLYFNQFNQAKL